MAQITSCLHAEVQVTCPHQWAVLSPPHNQGYQWLKDKILSEEGRRQQAKLKELQAIAERLGCTLPQLAIGNRAGGEGGGLTVVPGATPPSGSHGQWGPYIHGERMGGGP